MKFTPKKGLFRMGIATAAILAGLLLAESFLLGVVCIIFCACWLVCWLIGGFFDIE
ncbi:MAG: hypothetical protein JW947_08195 [Sedimentisphaerales bacterium]|nr:hypothetical protein [Sedimentisphaerales bacterium]